MSVSCQRRHFFRFAWTLNGFGWSLLPPTHELIAFWVNLCQEIRIDVNPVLPRSEWLDKFHSEGGIICSRAVTSSQNYVPKKSGPLNVSKFPTSFDDGVHIAPETSSWTGYSLTTRLSVATESRTNTPWDNNPRAGTPTDNHHRTLKLTLTLLVSESVKSGGGFVRTPYMATRQRSRLFGSDATVPAEYAITTTTWTSEQAMLPAKQSLSGRKIVLSSAAIIDKIVLLRKGWMHAGSRKLAAVVWWFQVYYHCVSRLWVR